MKPLDKDIEIVIREALIRYKKGKQEYGELDLSADQRDLLSEAEKELLDCINYCIFQVLRLRGIKAKNSYKKVTDPYKAKQSKAL